MGDCAKKHAKVKADGYPLLPLNINPVNPVISWQMLLNWLRIKIHATLDHFFVKEHDIIIQCINIHILCGHLYH